MQDIEDALARPETDVPSLQYPGRRVLKRKFSKVYSLVVVIEEPKEGSDIVVVTVFRQE
jgi:hypothetical protein